MIENIKMQINVEKIKIETKSIERMNVGNFSESPST